MQKYRDFFLSEEAYERYELRLKKKLRSYSTAYMNNAKWRKLLVRICENKELIKQCEIHNFFESGINTLDFSKINADFNQYIGEDYISNEIITAEYPTSYREIEYIEFLSLYWEIDTENTMKKNEKRQNIQQIKAYLLSFGQFHLEESKHYLRVWGYGR